MPSSRCSLGHRKLGETCRSNVPAPLAHWSGHDHVTALQPILKKKNIKSLTYNKLSILILPFARKCATLSRQHTCRCCFSLYGWVLDACQDIKSSLSIKRSWFCRTYTDAQHEISATGTRGEKPGRNACCAVKAEPALCPPSIVPWMTWQWRMHRQRRRE
jgi:hypothetical protein